jgi:hypothetical protein
MSSSSSARTRASSAVGIQPAAIQVDSALARDELALGTMVGKPVAFIPKPGGGESCFALVLVDACTVEMGSVNLHSAIAAQARMAPLLNAESYASILATSAASSPASPFMEAIQIAIGSAPPASSAVEGHSPVRPSASEGPEAAPFLAAKSRTQEKKEKRQAIEDKLMDEAAASHARAATLAALSRWAARVRATAKADERRMRNAQEIALGRASLRRQSQEQKLMAFACKFHSTMQLAAGLKAFKALSECESDDRSESDDSRPRVRE